MTKKIAIIGAGPGGCSAAVRAAKLGAEVTLIESEKAGGTCLHWGCIPSKIIKTTADLYERLQHAGEFGIDLAEPPLLNIARMMARKKNVVETQMKGLLALFKKERIRYIQGTARIEGPNRIRVRLMDSATVPVEWDSLIIATGTRPKQLPAVPFDGIRILSSDHLLEMGQVPGSAVIVGGGVIGCEFAFILSALGTQVTVVEEMPRVLPLPSVDEDGSKIILREMKKRRIAVHLNHRAVNFETTDGRVHVKLKSTEETPIDTVSTAPALQSDLVLVCIGRTPPADDPGFSTLGVKTSPDGWITVDNQMATNVPGVYAIGDILGPDKIMLAHAAVAEGAVAAENAMGNHKEMAYQLVPSAIFTMPEVAGVGLTERQARENGKPVVVSRFLFRQLGKAHVIGEIAGEVKMISEKETGRIAGVHIAGPHATDLISEAAVAIHAGCTVQELAQVIHPHPTLSEALMETALQGLFPES